MQAPRLFGADRAERLRAEAERLRPEMRELRLGRLGREQPDTRALLRAGLGEDELPTALELEPKRRDLGPFLAGPQVAKTTRGHQVDEHDELAVIGRKQQPLGATARSR